MSRVLRLLVGATGSVAAIKIPILCQQLKEAFGSSVAGKDEKNGVEIKVIATEHSLHFFDRSSVGCPVLVDSDEWKWADRSDPVLHIDLRNWADAIIIAPLDANTLAKLAGGLCDNLLTCVLRAWDFRKPVIACPAMNTHMWDHPLTAVHLKFLQEELKYHIVGPIAKRLACNDVGMGAMAEVPDIVKAAKPLVEAVTGFTKAEMRTV
ncbi:flavoprotein [Zopfochytrium polystomum]|nr:flavoprotein [Zopfochytrium polystomum]